MDAENLLAHLRAEIDKLPPNATIKPEALTRVLGQWESIERDGIRQLALEAQVKALQEARDKDDANRILADQITFLSAVWDKSSAFTNLIMIAGYASFFGLWSLLKDLNRPLNRYSVIAMLVSVCIYVCFEFVKMMYLGITQHRRFQAVNKPAASVAEMLKRLEVFRAESERSSVWFMRAWKFAVPPAAAAAALSLGLLAWDLVEVMLKPT